MVQPDSGNFVRVLTWPAADDGIHAEGGLRCRGLYKTVSGNDNRPLITVIIAVRNGARHLEEALLSVLNQSYDRLELVVIDGGSDDESVDIIRRYEQGIDYWLSQPDGGVYEAFNKGVCLATGDWVCVLGADDHIAFEGTMTRMAAELANCADTVLLAYGDVAMVANDAERLCVIAPAWLEAKSKLKHSMSLPYPGLMHRRAWFDKYSLYDTAYRMAGDYEMLLRGWPDEDAMHVVGVLVVNMRTGGMSNSSTLAELSEKEMRRAQCRHGISFTLKERCAKAARNFVHRLLQHMFGDDVIWRIHSARHRRSSG